MTSFSGSVRLNERDSHNPHLCPTVVCLALTLPPVIIIIIIIIKGMKTTNNNRTPSEKLPLSKCLRWTCLVFFVYTFTLMYSSKPGINENIQDKPHKLGIGPQSIPIDDDVYGIVRPKNTRNDDDDTDDDEEYNLQTNPFVRQHCILQDGMEWYPTNNTWKTRAPYFLLIGAKKCGTSALSNYLHQHPQIAKPRRKELLFFLPHRFPAWKTTNSNNNKILKGQGSEEDFAQVRVKEARQYMWQNDYQVDTLARDEAMLSYEATPGYVLYSTYSARAMLCTIPWVKLLVILRNPVDRVFSNYHFLRSMKLRPVFMPTLEAWIDADLVQLRQAGVLQDEIPPEDFYGSVQERQAWTRYQRTVRNEGPVARSLYVLQFQEWFDHLRAIGRDPQHEVLVVQSEELKKDPSRVMDTIHYWLELPPNPVLEKEEKMVTNYTKTSMKNETRAMLEELFRPYNQRLYNLLGGEWEGVWDGHGTVKVDDEGEKEEEKEETKPSQTNVESTRFSTMGSATTRAANLTSHYDLSPSHDVAKGEAFTKKWCVLEEGVEWYPSNSSENAWMLRTPYFMLPGAKKSGTTSLASYIGQHPLMAQARTKELQFFLNKNFRRTFVNDDRKTLVKQARERMFALDYHTARIKIFQNKITMDATPGYLFFSAMLPQRILCVAPWIKLVVILRNPVDRAYSNHAYVMRMRARKIPFERYIQDDFHSLTESGFLNATTPEEEELTWPTYLRLASEGPIGRSLYEIQLRQWFQAFRDIGRDPKTQVHIVRSEDLKKDLQGEMKKVYAFLGLPHVPVLREAKKVVSNYDAPMNPQTREMLENFFAPYNKRLYDMLGGDWEGFWDPSPKNTSTTPT